MIISSDKIVGIGVDSSSQDDGIFREKRGCPPFYLVNRRIGHDDRG